MPQLLGLVLLGAGVIAGYKAIRRVAARMADEINRAEDEARRARSETPAGSIAKDLGALELDPDSGVYMPRRS